MSLPNGLMDLTSLAVANAEARRLALDRIFGGSEAAVRQAIASNRLSGSLPIELVHQLVSAGLVRLLLPAIVGGLAVDPGTVLLILEELSRVSGSLGWTSMVACESPVLLSMFEQETFASLYADGGDVLLASSSAASGIATRVSKGWSISGEWPFATGSAHCQFFLAFSRDSEGTLLGSLHPVGQLIRLDNWHPIGLKSTASCNVRLQDAFVPEAHTFYADGARSCSTDPVMVAAPSEHFGLHMAAVAMGILAHILEVSCREKRQDKNANAKRKFEDASLLEAVGRADTVLRVGRAASQSAMQDLLDRASTSPVRGGREAAACLCIARYIVAECVDQARNIFALSGSEVVLETSELQECLGDLHCLAQHANLSPGRFAQLGSLMLQRVAGESSSAEVNC